MATPDDPSPIDLLERNRADWNAEARSGTSRWCIPVDHATIERARAGDWEVILTPNLPVPRAWFGEVRGRDVLCLASGGGQQAPVLAAAGARVTSHDPNRQRWRKSQRAFWLASDSRFSDRSEDGKHPLHSLDVCGAEWAHARRAGLEIRRQQGER